MNGGAHDGGALRTLRRKEPVQILTAEDVKKQAKALGADVVGIAPMERYEGAPIQMDPRQIMPDARALIVMGFRIMRGSFRGIEQGTFFSNYSSMGYGALNWLYIPMTVITLAKFIEDHGYEAVPMGHLSPWRAINNDGTLRRSYSRPVAPGRAHPDIMIHMRIAAYLAGLGEIGYSKVFLTPQFGPRQRIGIVLTEADLAPDPIYDGEPLCDRCMECVRECPAGAISETKTVKVELAGRTVEWNDLDLEACNIAFRGGMQVESANAEGHYMAERTDVKRSPITPFYRKPGNIYIHGQAICGGKSCMRACMIHLEERGVLTNKFKKPFRRQKPWLVDWSVEPEQLTGAERSPQR